MDAAELTIEEFNKINEISKIYFSLDGNIFEAPPSMVPAYLVETGYYRSLFEKVPVDANGSYIPWITYPCISFLEERLTRNLTVFEFGCGASTVWWSDRVKQIYSIEDNEYWYKKIKEKSPENVKLELVDTAAYSSHILNYENMFDIIIIDGSDRFQSLKNSLSALKPGGVVILDDTDKIVYDVEQKFLYTHGFKRIGFAGLRALVGAHRLTSETSIFYRADNCLNI